MSIRWKLVTMFMALVFLVMVVTGTFVIMSMRLAEESSQAEELANHANQIYGHVILPAFNAWDEDEDRQAMEQLFSETFGGLIAGRLPANMYAFIISGQTRMTLETTADNSTGFYDFLNQQVVIAALNGEEVFSPPGRQYADHLGRYVSFFELAVPVFLGEQDTPDYVIYMRSNAYEFMALQNSIVGTIGLAALLALLGASVLSIVFAGSITQNLLRLNNKISDYKVGAAIEPIAIDDARDEIGRLAISFNVMSRDLNAGMAAITNEKNKMEIILYNMTDGVLAYDEAGVLLHSNYACEELLGIKGIELLGMEELFGRIGIDFPEGSLMENMDNREDAIINIGEKYVNVSFNPYKSEDGRTQGVIIVFQDITKHMLLDNMRKEFVANVSHELRTPLTTIKSYTETLMDGAGDDVVLRDDFLNVINNETDRMTNIIKDLLDLSRFDNKKAEFDFDFVDLVALVENNVRQHKIMGDKTNKEIIFTSELISAHIHMDPERINQVLDNIITNSFRYSGDGARVEVEIHESGRFYMVLITDNGIGIPRENLRMIFERFYRVDKARSRELGGTGLGLPIAKEIMEAHGGRINVTSELGVGTTMMLRFPKDRRGEEWPEEMA